MPLNDDQRDLLKQAETLTAGGDPARGASVLRELIESMEPDDHEDRGRLTITLAHFLRQAGDTEEAIKAYLRAASLLEAFPGEAILEAAHACFGAGMLLLNTDHPDASKTTARALGLYQRFPFTRPADLADAAVLNLAAQVFVDRQSSEAAFNETWQLVRCAPLGEMTSGILEQWMLMVQTWLAALSEEKGAELVRDVQRWCGKDEGESSRTQAQREAQLPPLPPAELLDEIREGYDELMRGQKRGAVLPQIEVDVIKMTLQTLQQYDAELHPPRLLAGAFFSLGRSFTELDDEERAEHCYRRSLACDPAHAGARYNLGNVLMRRGENEVAAEHFRQVVNADPDNHFALRNLTYVLAKGGDLASAIDVAATTTLVATDPEIAAARLLELCSHYDGWEIARPVVRATLQTKGAAAERVRQLRALLAPLLDRS
ncbi:MAG: tetratricopeptide repeat protein [Candidatus Methylomirabilales bacterium]